MTLEIMETARKVILENILTCRSLVESNDPALTNLIGAAVEKTDANGLVTLDASIMDDQYNCGRATNPK